MDPRMVRRWLVSTKHLVVKSSVDRQELFPNDAPREMMFANETQFNNIMDVNKGILTAVPPPGSPDGIPLAAGPAVSPADLTGRPAVPSPVPGHVDLSSQIRVPAVFREAVISVPGEKGQEFHSPAEAVCPSCSSPLIFAGQENDPAPVVLYACATCSDHYEMRSDLKLYRRVSVPETPPGEVHPVTDEAKA